MSNSDNNNVYNKNFTTLIDYLFFHKKKQFFLFKENVEHVPVNWNICRGIIAIDIVVLFFEKRTHWHTRNTPIGCDNAGVGKKYEKIYTKMKEDVDKLNKVNIYREWAAFHEPSRSNS